MGACATKPADLKVKGEAPLVVEDGVAEKKAGGGVLEAADPVTVTDDVGRRRSLSDLLKEVAEESDGDAPGADEKTEPPTAANNKTVATDEHPLAVTAQPSTATTEQYTAEKLEEPEATQEDHDAHAQAVEEEKRMDPDSLQVAAQNAEENKVADAPGEKTD